MGAPNGASHYLIYTKSGGGDACTSGTLVNQVSAESYTNGQVVTLPVTGLTERTSYSVCVKARDEAGNISANTNFQTRSTLDITAPIFDGLQSVLYSNSNARIELSWNPSPSADVKEYKVYVWKTLPATTLVYQHSTSSTGANFNTSSFSYADNDTLYFVVDACDTAAALPGGTQNCTAYPQGSKKTLILPDVNPPVGFNGISGVTMPSAGTANVSWYAPSNWTGYAGFKVYHVTDTGAGTLSLLKSCPCASSDCVANPISSCSVTGLAKRKTYQFYVSAYDAANNETVSLLPATNAAYRVPMQTTDTAAPTFSSSLALNWVASPTAGVEMTWSPGSDDQDISEPDSVNVGLGAQLRYQVYRKANITFSSFSAGNTPPGDGTALLGTATNLNTYVDPSAGLTQGFTYYYTVCIRDASVNVYCDGVVQSIQAPDGTPPVLSNFISTKVVNATSWNMTWSMSDTGTSNPQLKVWLCRSTSGTPATNCTDNRLADGATSFADSEVSGSTLVYYRLRVVDLNNNEATLTAQSLNAAPTISGISPTQSNIYLDGGENITITGTGFLTTSQGFASNPTVLIGNALCTNSTVNTTSITCTTPAMSPGVYSVTVTNPDLQTGTSGTNYTYRDFCDLTGLDGSYQGAGVGGGISAGDGLTASTPFLICTKTQMNNVATTNASGGAGFKYYKLMKDIDYGNNSFVSTITNFNGYFDGNGKTISNINMSFASAWMETYGGVFRNINSGSTVTQLTVSNLNMSISGSVYAYFGAITGSNSGTISKVTVRNSNIAGAGATNGGGTGGIAGYNNGTIEDSQVLNTNISSNANVAGFIGYQAQGNVRRNYTYNTTVTGTSVNYADGGFIAYIVGNPSTTLNLNDNYVDTVTVNGTYWMGGLWSYARTENNNFIMNVYRNAVSNFTANSFSGVTVGGLGAYLRNVVGPTTNIYDNFARVTSASTASHTKGGIIGYLENSLNNTNTRNIAVGSFNTTAGPIFGICYDAFGGNTNCNSTTANFFATSLGATFAVNSNVGASQAYSSTQLRTQSNFTSAGYNFNAVSGVWRMPSCVAAGNCTGSSWNEGYPAIQGVHKFTCPSGFVYVPMSSSTFTGVTQYGNVRAYDFCVAKYEMKDDGSGNAVSQASGSPWTNISQTTALAKCQAMGTGYDLISNEQWQSIARNIEATATNWSGSAVGSGMLSVGLHNSVQSTGQAASSSDSEPCLYTNRNCQKRSDTNQWIYKRTLTLSNGNVIWDFAGNVSEHIKDTKASLSLTNLTTSSDFDFSHVDFGTDDTTVNRKVFGPYTSSYTAASQRTGLVTGGSGSGVIRGGAYNSSVTRSGIYATNLQLNGDNVVQTGFRCVWQP